MSHRDPFVFTQDFYDVHEMVLARRFAEAIESATARYPIFRELRFAARLNLDELLDCIALSALGNAHRIEGRTLLLDFADAFAVISGGRKADYSSCHVSIWASDAVAAARVREHIEAQVSTVRITEPMFSIDWHFLTGRGVLESASIEELAVDAIHDEAYPELPRGVAAFVNDYLAARETVLVLQGPPGTGKTRLIRAILGEMSRRAGGEASALYTGDKKALESDEIFVKFITGRDSAFVIEDADHVLKPRADGNEELHRFLAIADGVVQAQGRKIIFSTNLPNVGDLDDALVRPGRCFARVHVRLMTASEALVLAKRLTGSAEAAARVLQALAKAEKGVSVAELYQAAERVGVRSTVAA
jgi:hypothetical protein